MRLREETEFRPKPMVEIGGKPILWHIMSHYSLYGFNDFVLCLGYKGDMIREYFLGFTAMNTDVRVTLGTRSVEYLDSLEAEKQWTVTLCETGAETRTGGRLLRARRHLDEEAFLCTYGDGVSNVDLSKLVTYHRSKGALVTATGVRPPSRFGELTVHDGLAEAFEEKPKLHAGRVNGGFFVMETEALTYVHGDEMFERAPMERLTAARRLAVFEHDGYWASMDTYRDMMQLNEEWASGRPGWMERP